MRQNRQNKEVYILNEIKRVANEIAPHRHRLTKRLFLEKSDVTNYDLRSIFRSWKEALQKAEIDVAPREYTRLSEDQLMDAIEKLIARLGKRPTEADMGREGEYSTKPYRDRWGSFSKAVDYYVKRSGQSVSSSESGPRQKRALATQEIATHIPAHQRNRTRPHFGEPLDFRGLRHAPVNEQGVVYLFGMVSRELGYHVEIVRTEYPDCEAIRKSRKKKDHWERIQIEFEYKSKNFLEHGHDPSKCDLIVCWIHNWPDPPVEVLELKSTIRTLSESASV